MNDLKLAPVMKGNVTVEYVICLTFFFIMSLMAGGLFADDGVIGLFRNAYTMFFNGFSSTVLNMDVIPNEINGYK